MPKVKAGGGGSAPVKVEGTEEVVKPNVFGTGPDQYTVTVKADETVTVIVEE